MLNAKHHEKEAKIISQAGKAGSVTLATNMAGRGVDIILGGSLPDKATKDQIKDWGKEHQKVIELDPKDVLGYFSLGTVLLGAKRLEEAGSAFEKAVAVDPNHSPSYFSLGVALEALGRKGEAVKIYERGIQVADGSGDMIPLRKMEARLKMLTENT